MPTEPHVSAWAEFLKLLGSLLGPSAIALAPIVAKIVDDLWKERRKDRNKRSSRRRKSARRNTRKKKTNKTAKNERHRAK